MPQRFSAYQGRTALITGGLGLPGGNLARRPFEPARQDRLWQYTPGLWPPALLAGGRGASRRSARHQRYSSISRRELSSALSSRLRLARHVLADDQCLWPASIAPSQSPELHRLVHSSSDGWRRNRTLRRRAAAARFELCG